MSSRKSCWITIGKYPEWNIRKARHEYDLLYEQVHDYGRDPVREEKEQTAKEASRETAESFTKTYLELGRLKNKAFIEEEERYFRQDIWPVIGDLLLDEVTPDDIDQFQLNIIKRAKSRKRATRGGKVAAKHAIACTRRLFNLAKKKGKCEHNPVNDIEPLGETGKRNRVLSFEEIWRFWNGPEKAGIPPVTANALKFALVTMQRSNEVRNMRYSSYKASENVWQMETHETKNKTMHRVPMNRYALEIMEHVKPYTGVCPYVYGENNVTGEVYVQYSYDFEKRRAAQVWEFILDQIVTCKSPEEIPSLEELRERVMHSGLL